MRTDGVCPYCGETVFFLINGKDWSRVCSNCYHKIDIDEVTEVKE